MLGQTANITDINPSDGKSYSHFMAVLESNKRMVWAMCWHHAGGDREVAKDLAQDVWVAVWRNFGHLRQGSNAVMERAWVWWMARTTLANSTRRRRTERLPAGYDMADNEALEQTRQREHIEEALSVLGEQEKRVVCMRLESYEYPAIAAATGTSATAAKQTMHRALQKMRNTTNNRSK